MSSQTSAMQMGTQMSLNTLQGTARYVGTGGVISSVGGDISNLTTNPAGLGMFSRSELEFTPTISVNNVNSNYMYINGSNKQMTNWDNNRVKFTINSLGLVIANRKSETEPLRNSNIIIGLNRTADFNRSVNFGVGENRVYSYSNYLADLATDYRNISGFPAGNTLPTINNYYSLDNEYSRVLMARQAQLVYYNTAGGYYEDPMPYNNSSLLKARQFGQIRTTGGVSELSFAWAASIHDKYYIGVSLGIPFMSYKSELMFSEDNNGATASSPSSFYGNYYSMDLNESDYYSGTGVNLKLGGMAKLTNELKISGYVHSPTFYEINNEYAVGMTTTYQFSTNPKTETLQPFTFQYITPFKAGLGVSYMLGKSGFVGAEYEFTNLDNLSINFENEPENTTRVNSFLRAQNQDVHTFRIGGEYVLPSGNDSKSSPLRLRAGYNYRTSPTTASYVEQRGDQVAHTYTAGIGYRGKTTSIDLTYMKTQYRDFDYLYGYEKGNTKFDYVVTSWNSINQLVATINFRFK